MSPSGQGSWAPGVSKAAAGSGEARGGPSPRSPSRAGKASRVLLTHPRNSATRHSRTRQGPPDAPGLPSGPRHYDPSQAPASSLRSPPPGPEHPTYTPFSCPGNSVASSWSMHPQKAARSQFRCHSKRMSAQPFPSYSPTQPHFITFMGSRIPPGFPHVQAQGHSRV